MYCSITRYISWFGLNGSYLDAKGVDLGANRVYEDVIRHCELKFFKASMAGKSGCQRSFWDVDVCNSSLKVSALRFDCHGCKSEYSSWLIHSRATRQNILNETMSDNIRNHLPQCFGKSDQVGLCIECIVWVPSCPESSGWTQWWSALPGCQLQLAVAKQWTESNFVETGEQYHTCLCSTIAKQWV